MNSDRVEKLKKMALDDPQEPFYLYALGLEYQVHQPALALALFEQVMDKFKDYLPVYYIAGQLYLSIDPSKAREIFEQGIEIARIQQNQKSLNELQRALEGSMEND